MKIWLLIGAGVAAAAALLSLRKDTDAKQEEQACVIPAGSCSCGDEERENMLPTETVRATIREACRDMDPVTLQGWSRVIFSCEDGAERKMQFPGENGLYLTEGESGLLEHRNGAFVSFEKDSGEIVGALYHIPAENGEE